MWHRWDEKIKLRHLRVAMAIHEHGSVTDAAEALFVSQAAVSKTIAEAEETLQVELFVRRGRGIVPTEAGVKFIQYGQRISAEIRVLEAELTALSHGVSGQVVIGTSAVSAHIFTAEVITHLKGRSPGINIRLHNYYGVDILTDLRAGKLDLAIAPISAPDLAPDLEAVSLLNSEPVLVAGVGHPAIAMKQADWESLTGFCWCLPPPNSRWRIHLEKHWAELGMPSPSNLVESAYSMTLLALLRAMPALSVLPEGVARYWEEQGYLVRLPHFIPMTTDPVGLIWSKSLSLAPAARVVKETAFTLLQREAL